MKSKKYLILILILALSLPFASATSAEQEQIYFTTVEECDVDTVQIAREIFNGQENYLAKNWTQTCHDKASIPQYTGTVTIDINMILVGKGHFVSDEGGVWNMNCLFPWPRYAIQCTGKGEGLYEGMQIFLPAKRDVAGSGYIVDHSK